MSNFTILYDNQVIATTVLSGGAWNSTGRVLNNLLDYRVKKVARSNNALAASTIIRFAFPASVYIQALVLAAVAGTVALTYRWRLFSDAAFSIMVYDSGTLNWFPSGSMPNSQIPAGAPNAGTGQPLQVEVDRFQRNIYHLLGANAQFARYGQIDIVDTTNPAGWLEVGRLFVGKVFQPAINPAYGDLSFRVSSRTEKSRARDGTTYFNQQRPDFSLPVGFKYLTEDEAMKWLDLQVILDTCGEAMAIFDPAQVAYWWRRQVFGNLAQLDPIQHPMYANFATAAQVEGVL